MTPVSLVYLPSRAEVSPFNYSAWKFYLRSCPGSDVDWFLNGLCKGFSIGIESDKLASAKRNLPSVYPNPEIIDKIYLEDDHEINFLTIAGPFDCSPFSNTHVNRFGIIPKRTPTKWRLITDLSYPPENSVIDGIHEELRHASCPGIQQAIKKIMKHGKGALMSKFDMTRSYRNIFQYVNRIDICCA